MGVRVQVRSQSGRLRGLPIRILRLLIGYSDQDDRPACVLAPYSAWAIRFVRERVDWFNGFGQVAESVFNQETP